MRYPTGILRFVSLTSVFFAASLQGQASVGLSSVKAAAFANQSIGFNVPYFNDLFAWSLAAGDFDGDGAMDLASGMPGDDGSYVSPVSDAGAVLGYWGVSGTGLSATREPFLLTGYGTDPLTFHKPEDEFGSSLAAGDFNGDGRADLAVGIPGLDRVPDWSGSCDDWAGGVALHYGTPSGIQGQAEHHFSQSDPTFPDPPGDDERIGHSLAAGDFDGDGFTDLAIGAPSLDNWCNSDPSTSGGAVIVLHGGVGGLRPVSGYLIHQDDPPVPDGGEDEDDFGYALAAGNFDGDVRCIDSICRPVDDLAMSAPGEDNEGAVMIMYGSQWGLIFAESTYLGQYDVGGTFGEFGDRFGTSLAAGNFDGDCCDDLAIGDPHEDLGPGNSIPDAGEVTVLYGLSGRFFDLARTDHLRQSGIFGGAAFDATYDSFGWALAAGDFDCDGRDDLALGHPGERVGGTRRGGVTVLSGGLFGLYDRYRFFAAGIGGIPPAAQDTAEMGRALARGDFDGTGCSDLAIGSPYWENDVFDWVGSETILYGALFADGFESGIYSYWEWNP